MFIVRLDPSFSCLTWFCVWQVLLASCLAFRADIQIHTPRHILQNRACNIKVVMKFSWWNAHVLFLLSYYKPPYSLCFGFLSHCQMSLAFPWDLKDRGMVLNCRGHLNQFMILKIRSTRKLLSCWSWTPKYTAYLLHRTGNSKTVSFL